MKLERTRRGNPFGAAADDRPKVSETATESWLRPHPKFQLQKVIVPVDFSEPSEKALQYALSIAQEFQSEIILVHVVQLYPIMAEFPSATPELNASLIKEANAQLKKLRARIKSTPCRSVALGGSPAREIVVLAKAEQADLIVVGTHGRTGVAHAFLGSVAEKIVRHAPCPTLVVRAHERDFVFVAADDAEANLRRAKAKSLIVKG